MQIYFQYPAGGKEPKAGEEGSEFRFTGGRGFTTGWGGRTSFHQVLPSLSTPESCFWHPGSLCHLRHLIFKWRSWLSSAGSVEKRLRWASCTVCPRCVLEQRIVTLEWQGTFSAAPVWSAVSRVVIVPPLTEGMEGICSRRRVLGSSPWSCRLHGASPSSLGARMWIGMSPAYSPPCPRTSHWAGVCTDQLLNKYPFIYFYSTGGLSFVKTPDAPALLQDIYKGLLLYVFRRSLGSHSFGHLCFLVFSCWLEMSSFFWQRS